MAETDKKQGGPQAMLRGLLVVVVVAAIAVAGIVIYQRVYRPGLSLESAQQVAMLDSEAIYALPEFTKAKKELDDLSSRMEAELVKTVKGKKLNGQEAESLRVQMRDKLQEEQAKRVAPLNKRVTLAIAGLAVERKYRVVLDKRIVVTGVVDITADVKKKFEENYLDLMGADVPKEAAEAESESNVGYVNQDVISDLRIFKEAQQKLFIEYQKMAQKLQQQTEGRSSADKEKMRQDMVRLFQERQNELMKPINDRVTEAITEVAKGKGLSLVLNSHHIMWGGRNLTDDVVKKLIQPTKS